MRRDLLGRLQRIFLVFSLLLLAVIGLLAAQGAGWSWTPEDALARLIPPPPEQPKVVLISGHAGSDSGAVCTDELGRVTLTEAEINADVTQRAAAALEEKGYAVAIFDEFDARLDGLQAALLLSLHVDSCVSFSGYKAAHREGGASAADARLLACVDESYPAATGLAYHPDTITRDMIGYHAFRKIDRSTPGVILEMGFLGGDQRLLTEETERVALGIVNGVACFMTSGRATPPPRAR